MIRRVRALGALVLTLCALPLTAWADEFTYEPPGELQAGSGEGREDDTIYAPGLRFPLETGPAYANSQVWGNGGGQGEGSQCDEVNFSYPWRDNYCESRSWDMPLCPSGSGHQGQDLRASDCEKDKHWVVAVTDGTITEVGSYTVYLTAADGTRYDYLHMSNVQVDEGDEVTVGQRLGKVSNQFGGTPTTIHLHFNIRQSVAGVGKVFVPPYTSLVSAYQNYLDPPPADAGVPDDGGKSMADSGAGDDDAGSNPQGGSARGRNAALEDEGCSLQHHAGAESAVLVGLALVAAVRRRRRG